MRIVSLLPSATEIVYLLGGQVVGRSHECDFPEAARNVPVLTAQRTDPAADPQDTDSLVRDLTASGESLYTLDTDLLARLRPDLILTQDLCSVCSIDLAAVQRAVGAIAQTSGREPRVVALNPHTVEDILDDVLRIGEAIDRREAATVAVVGMRQRMFEAQELVTPFDPRQPVLGFLEWTEPLFVAGHWTVQMIERAGGRHPWNETVRKVNAGAAAGPQQAERVAGPSISVPPEVFAAAEPEYVIVAPCGYSLDQAEAAARRLFERDWFRSLPAARNGRVVAVDGSAYFNRPGPRIIDAFCWLVGWLQDRPELTPGFRVRQIEAI